MIGSAYRRELKKRLTQLGAKYSWIGKTNEELEQMIKRMAGYEVVTVGAIPLAPLPTVKVCNQEKKETNMRTENDIKRDHLSNRMYQLDSQKEMEINRHFGLQDDEYPRTAKEFVKRIQDGRFVLRDQSEADYFESVLDYIRFRDPNKVADKDGAWEARKLLSKDFRDTMDTVAIMDPAEGLKAVQAFEAKQYH